MSTPPQGASSIDFSAPWSRQLKWITVLTSLFLLGTSAALQINTPTDAPPMYQLGVWLPLVIFALCALCSVRGYRLKGEQLIIRRLGWNSCITLGNIVSVAHEPDAIAASIRIFGNGGFFGFIGLFRNQKLGRYRAFATDGTRCVVIRLAASTLVVTPDNPQRFVQALMPFTGKR